MVHFVSALCGTNSQNCAALEVFLRFARATSLGWGRKSLPLNTFAFCRQARNTRASDFIGPLSALALRAGSGVSEETADHARQNEASFCSILSLFNKRKQISPRRTRSEGTGYGDRGGTSYSMFRHAVRALADC